MAQAGGAADDGPDVGVWGGIAVALAAVGWVAFIMAFFFARDPWPFLVLGVLAGAAGLGLSLWLRQNAPAAAGGSAAAAAGAMAYGLSIATLLTAALYATGVLVAFILLLMLVVLMSGPWWTGGGHQGGGSCCEDCCSGGAACGGGGCGCGDVGCSGGSGGCACVGLASAAPLRARLAHHPDVPEYEADVFRVAGARLCVGCFTAYPAFLAGLLALALAPPVSWAALLGAGLLAALAQLVSTVGLATTRARKVAVKASLGLGLALVTWGVHGAPWPLAWRLLALLLAMGLAFASAVPRARRMRRARAA